MTVRLERDPGFWLDVAHDPDVASRMGVVPDDVLLGLIAKPGVLPIASENGGFLFSYLDALHRVCELHTMFKPAGWGREVHGAAKEAFNLVFAEGVALVVTYQTEGNRLSQPPVTFGFVAVGEFEPSVIGPIKTWMLTRTAWRASHAGKLS